MAVGNSIRMDSRRSSSGCSTATVVLFISLCLLGVWMMTSWAVVPREMNSTVKNTNVKQEVLEKNPRTYEDSSGDVTEEITSNDDKELGAEQNLDNNNVVKQNEIYSSEENPKDQSYNSDKIVGSTTDQEDNSVNISESTTSDESENTPKTQTFTDENGQTEGGVIGKEGKEKIISEQIPQEKDQILDNSGNGEQYSDETKGVQQQKPDENSDDEKNREFKREDQVEEGGKEPTENPGQLTTETETKENVRNEELPNGAESELLNETNTQNAAWPTQTAESNNEKEFQSASSSSQTENYKYTWKLCNVTAGTDYIPCLDNEDAIKKLKSTKHYEHRERHCPDEPPTCLVPLPEGYKQPISWPDSRNKIWYANVPRTKLATVKGHQNWVKVTGEYLTFPGGGTQFKHGALHYIDFIQQCWPKIAWGKTSRVVLDVGCGVASFGGFLFDRNVLAMSLAPKDEHEAQVQFALERGIPAISAVMGTKRLPFPGTVYDVVHCARCRVPWHIEGGKLLLELNRLLRPGGYFVWSATPVYQDLPEDVQIWKDTINLTRSMCWEMVNKSRDRVNEIGVAIFRKPMNNKCLESRENNNPPICEDSDDANAAWNVPLQACMHKIPVTSNARGSQWPTQWPKRAVETPYWLDKSQLGVYGKPAPDDFKADYDHWKHVVSKTYINGLGLDWSKVRNVMDMRAVYGGFASVLRDMNVWVMNIVSVNSPDTLPIIFERGFFGIYHDWCESFSTYPRTYDLLHADHLFSSLNNRCKLQPVIAEVDRILRPEGRLIVRDKGEILEVIESMAKSMHWETRMTYSKEKEGFLFVQKKSWRPAELEGASSLS